jgi:ApbE superfamily uncharacterized protein (UPF0280 family)
MAPHGAMLADGKRLHLQHGPIDLIIEGFGDPVEIEHGYRAAAARFETILDELVAELPALRRAYSPAQPFAGIVARRMADAVAPYALDDGLFVTPMAAVAGAVGDEILSAMLAASSLDKAYVNNGGDIALHLAVGESFDVALAAMPQDVRFIGQAKISAEDGIGGIATSGRHGRSLSFGIADSVTVLAKNAAAGDVAATIIANNVCLKDHPAVAHCPATDLDPDSDLGEKLVVQAVGELSPNDIRRALSKGLEAAQRIARIGRIKAAALYLNENSEILSLRAAHSGKDFHTSWDDDAAPTGK